MIYGKSSPEVFMNQKEGRIKRKKGLNNTIKYGIINIIYGKGVKLCWNLYWVTAL